MPNDTRFDSLEGKRATNADLHSLLDYSVISDKMGSPNYKILYNDGTVLFSDSMLSHTERLHWTFLVSHAN
jgi:hypothetical protein